MRVPKDLEKMATGLSKAFDDFIKDGPTEFLKSTLFDRLSADHGRDSLQATRLDDYKALFQDLPMPLALTLPRQPWMARQLPKRCCSLSPFNGHRRTMRKWQPCSRPTTARMQATPIVKSRLFINTLNE